MTSSRDPVILVLLIILILGAAGCLGASINSGKPTASSLPVTAIGSTPATAPPPTTPVPSPGYWIKIDPISDKQIGEIFTINSTTNLAVGSEILIQIEPPMQNSAKQSREFSGGMGSVKVIPGTNGTNAISFVVNSSEFHLTPDSYFFREDAINENASGWVRFNINERNAR